MNPELTRLRHEDPDRFARELMQQQLAAERELKTEMCAEGPNDLHQRIIYLPANEDSLDLIVPMMISEHEPTPAEVILYGCRAAVDQLGPPFLIAFLAEAYRQLFPQGEKGPRVRGVITQRFEQGNPTVAECLSIFMMHRRMDGTLRSLATTQPFTYVDGDVTFGEVMWVDSLDDGEEVGIGAIPEAMAVIFNAGGQN